MLCQTKELLKFLLKTPWAVGTRKDLNRGWPVQADARLVYIRP